MFSRCIIIQQSNITEKYAQLNIRFQNKRSALVISSVIIQINTFVWRAVNIIYVSQ